MPLAWLSREMLALHFSKMQPLQQEAAYTGRIIPRNSGGVIVGTYASSVQEQVVSMNSTP